MQLDEQQIKTVLQRISNILLINGGFLNNLGLFTGEMGLVLFFFRYARFNQNSLYADYSYDLIEKIQSRIHQETPINYEEGLTGIGSAFEYLVQNGFVEADTDDILEVFDKRIFALNNLPFLPVEDIKGIGYYALWRMSGKSSSTKLATKKDRSLKSSLKKIETFLNKKGENPNDIPTVRNNLQLLDEKNYSRLLDQLSKKDGVKKSLVRLGIQNGFAGLGLALLSRLDGDNSWTSLFPA